MHRVKEVFPRQVIGSRAEFLIWDFLSTKLMLCFPLGISKLPKYLNILHFLLPFICEARREAGSELLPPQQVKKLRICLQV